METARRPVGVPPCLIRTDTVNRTTNIVHDQSEGLSAQDQRNLICGILSDFAAHPDVGVLFAYLRHCGLPITAIRSAQDIVPAFLALYRVRPGVYDVDRACEDLRLWPPIAERIRQLTHEADDRGGPDLSAAGKLTHDL